MGRRQLRTWYPWISEAPVRHPQPCPACQQLGGDPSVKNGLAPAERPKTLFPTNLYVYSAKFDMYMCAILFIYIYWYTCTYTYTYWLHFPFFFKCKTKRLQFVYFDCAASEEDNYYIHNLISYTRIHADMIFCSKFCVICVQLCYLIFFIIVSSSAYVCNIKDS